MATFTDVIIPFMIRAYIAWIIEESPPFYHGVIYGASICCLFGFRVYCFR